jgi:5-methyltetrahydrofolate--homocysteine methyltransferase
LRARKEKAQQAVEQAAEKPIATVKSIRRSAVDRQASVFTPPDLTRHVLRNYPIAYLRPYLNEQMLLGRHLGVKGNVEKLLAAGDAKAIELKEKADALMQMVEQDHLLKPQGIYQFFPAQAEGDNILIYDPEEPKRIIERFSFPRQTKDPHLCLADFLRPVESGELDYVGFLAVTAGTRVRELAEEWKNAGEYLLSHMIQAVALELAEAFAERLHHQLRDMWGFPDPASMTMKERFGARYQGIRVSFGYPACPDLEDQRKLFQLLQPESIGIELTEGCMMEPEASVTAMVFAHPEARYFNAI